MMQSRTLETTRFNAGQGFRTVLLFQCVPVQLRTLGLCHRFNYAILQFFAILQFRTLEPCYTFQCSASLRNLVILSMLFRIP